MANKFQAGDLVQLKSGGPAMTVSSIADYGAAYYCQWFRGASTESHKFNEEVLKLYEAPKKNE